MKADAQPSHHILVNEPGLLMTQCYCCGEVELHFRSVAMAFNLTDLYALITRLDELPVASCYVVGLIDVRETTVRAGFQAIGLQLSEGEREQLLRALHLACLRLDMDLLVPEHLPLN